MRDEYFGIKELYQAVLRAKTPMNFGNRYIEAQEPVLYFENVTLSTLSERNSVVMARGGWDNRPRVIWEDRSEVTFNLREGVLSSISLGILLSSNVVEKKESEPILVSNREGPIKLDANSRMELQYWPVDASIRKTFIFEYDRDVAQRKLYGKRIHGQIDYFTGKEIPTLEVYEDKDLTILADITKNYIVDYYYEYEEGALIYSIQKERFNGLFSLEGKFYSKDENEGINYTNIMYMPKVRIVSDINLRLGERADPTMGIFNIIGLPEKTGNYNNLIVEMTRLNKDIDDE